MVPLQLEAILGPLINSVAICQEVRIDLDHSEHGTVFQYFAFYAFWAFSNTVIVYTIHIFVFTAFVHQEMVFWACTIRLVARLLNKTFTFSKVEDLDDISTLAATCRGITLEELID
jgi:hypothetical protein